MSTQKIIPNLWFDPGKFPAEIATEFYASVFKNSEIRTITRYGKAEEQIHGQQPGRVMTVNFSIEGHEFVSLNGGPHFPFNPSVSFFVICQTQEEVDGLWKNLSKNGQVLMPLDYYPWSPKYGWVQDKFGVSWQLMLEEPKTKTQKIIPSFLFTGKNQGNAEEAIHFYISVFKNSSLGGVLKYTEEDQNDYALGKVKHAQFQLEGQSFMAMDSGMESDFSFNESISFIIDCKDQVEIDYYWDKLSAVPKAEQCGWLKDKFGVSWQIVPSTILSEMLQDPDKKKRARAIASFMKMKKFNINKLKADFEGNSLSH
ncbi:VOC family protein [Salegentibacter sp. F14]